jgi:hypothetical protein
MLGILSAFVAHGAFLLEGPHRSPVRTRSFPEAAATCHDAVSQVQRVDQVFLVPQKETHPQAVHVQAVCVQAVHVQTVCVQAAHAQTMCVQAAHAQAVFVQGRVARGDLTLGLPQIRT